MFHLKTNPTALHVMSSYGPTMSDSSSSKNFARDSMQKGCNQRLITEVLLDHYPNKTPSHKRLPRSVMSAHLLNLSMRLLKFLLLIITFPVLLFHRPTGNNRLVMELLKNR